MAAPVIAKRIYKFGLFEIDPDGAKLWRQGAPVKLQDQPFRILCVLLERAGEVVTREQLRTLLWPEGTFVEFDGSLNAALRRLRYALDDDADNPIFIETVPRRGYRFIAPVQIEPSEPTESSRPQDIVDSARFGHLNKSRLTPWLWIAFAVAPICAAFLSWQHAHQKHEVPVQPVIAVLPFQNDGAGADFDYLQYAIGKELATELTQTRSVIVRPFATTSKFVSQPRDLGSIGKEATATHVLTGSFRRDKDDLQVNMELFYVARNETVWRDHFTVSPQELIKMEAQFATRITGGLLPAINVVAAPAAELPSSRNERAFVLYLRSLGVSHDPGEPNKVGINDLEESVALDSQYAPAWDELGWRYYIEYAYGNGGPGERDKVYEVHRLQREADPNGTANSITLRAEEGDLNGAYEEAAALLKRRPDSSIAHFEMGYMLRYAGLLDEAERECDTTIKIDPGWYVFRSCAQPFILDGKYVEARKYVHLDENSGFGALLRIEIALRTGDKQDTLAATSLAVENGFPLAKLVPYCFDHGSATELGKAAAELETDPRSDRDSELLYQNAATLSFCGQADAALRVLRKAIAGNYCSYPAMDKDPLFSSIRWRPEFGDLRRAGMACQQDFLAHRKLVDSQR